MTRFPSASQAFVRTLRSSAIREEWRRGDAYAGYRAMRNIYKGNGYIPLPLRLGVLGLAALKAI